MTTLTYRHQASTTRIRTASRTLRRRWCVPLAAMLVAGLAVPAAAASPRQPAQSPAATRTVAGTSAVAPAERDRVLGSGWRGSTDLAWTTYGDATGFHLAVARARTGYAWQTVATLGERGVDTSEWIGQACLTGSGRRAVVVYAPRESTNQEQLFNRGAFAAVVDLSTGRVTRLRLHVSVAYFNPGCGTAETAVLTQNGDEHLKGTRLYTLDTTTGRLGSPLTVDGEVTSAVPDGGRIVAARGSELVAISGPGAVRRLAATSGTPFRIHPASGGIVFSLRTGGSESVLTLSGGTTRTLMTSALGRLRVTAGTGGRVFVAGKGSQRGALPAGVRRLDVDPAAQLSTDGQLAVTTVDTRAVDQGKPAATVGIDALATATRRTVHFAVPAAGAAASAQNSVRDPVQDMAPADLSTDPVDEDRVCEFPRNDSKKQVYQPTNEQVEWAADQAVQGKLTTPRPANWKQSGLPSWAPQGMFLPPQVQVPPGILLGILAQESNLWQASSHALPGMTGNPLVGNFYGQQLYDDNPDNDWDVNWAKADCGYGIAQITDGMRLGDYTLMGPTEKNAVAVDYATNIARALVILSQKWSQLQTAGMTVNNGDPRWIENWYYAVWAYNSGFHDNQGDGGPWGVGWANNPANPVYPADRLPFLDNNHYIDAKYPQNWPYQEKVLGWAAWPLVNQDGAGYHAAWWTSSASRTALIPKADLLCTQADDCFMGSHFPNDYGLPGPCSQADLTCWVHYPISWKHCATDLGGAGECGYSTPYYAGSQPEPADGTYFPPQCDPAQSGAPSGALIVDDVPADLPSARPNCPHHWTDSGSFAFQFPAAANGTYPAKVDLHQVGTGLGGHLWFSHTLADRNAYDDQFTITGTWTLNQQWNGRWGRVVVYMPGYAAETQQANYVVHLGDGRSETRVLLQHTGDPRWVSLGVFQFHGTPSVSLSTVSSNGIGVDDVAWDAVAFQPLPGRPKHIVVALGDSFSSGEGVTDFNTRDEGPETNNYDDYDPSSNYGGDTFPPSGNGCHRSLLAWPGDAHFSDEPLDLNDLGPFAPDVDYQLLACSGGTTDTILPSGETNALGKLAAGQFQEVTQLDRGFLDENTDLVTISVGGNDARTHDVLAACIDPTSLVDCMGKELDGETQPMSVTVPAHIKAEVKDSVAQVLRDIHARAPNARIVLMGYPHLISDPLATRPGDWTCVFGAALGGVSKAEQDWLASMGDLLDSTLADLATDIGPEGIRVYFADPRQEFTGHELCNRTGPEALHRPVLAADADVSAGEPPAAGPQSALSLSMHPNLLGAQLYGEVLNQTLSDMGL